MRPRAAAGPCRDTCSRFGKGSTCERVMEKRGAGFQVVASVPNKAGQLCLPAPPPGPPPSSQCLPGVLHPDAPVPQGLGPGHRAGLARQLEDGTGRSGEVRQCGIQTGAGRGRGGRPQLRGPAAQPRSRPKAPNRRPGSVGVGSAPRGCGAATQQLGSAVLQQDRSLSSLSLLSKLVGLGTGKGERGQMVASRAGPSSGWDPGGARGLGRVGVRRCSQQRLEGE